MPVRLISVDMDDRQIEMPDDGAGDRLESADAELLRRARGGDLSAHSELYERFSADVMTVARRILGSPSRAEDVLQDTFVEVIRKVQTFRGHASIGTWIHRIAVNKCLDQMRSRWWSDRRTLDEIPGSSAVEALDPGQHWDIEKLLDGLPDVARAVVWLHEAEGYTHREIAELMGRSESFSKSQLQRAHQKLRQALRSADENGLSNEAEIVCNQAVRTT